MKTATGTDKISFHQLALIVEKETKPYEHASDNTQDAAHQDAVKAIVNNWPRSKQLITYKYLNALGCKLDSLDYEIDKEIKKELEQGMIDPKDR